MIAWRSLLRLNFHVRETTNTYAKSKPLLDFQKPKFWHGFSCELNMDARNGRGNVNDRKKQKNVRQTWRAVSSQPDCSEGDGESVMVQNRQEEVCHGTSSTVSIAECGNSNIGVLDEPVGLDTGLVTEGGKIDESLHENFAPPKKHSLSVEIGASLMRFIKGKGGSTQEKIEVETGVKIIFPSSKKDDLIVLEGNSAESITQASEKIQTIIDKAVNSRELDYSHFVSLPLAIHPGLLDKLVNFQNTILRMTADDKDKNKDNDTGGDTVDEEEEENHSTAPKVSVELKVEKADANIEENVNNNQCPTETPVVAEVKAVGTDRHVRVNVTSIPLVSYPPKESKATSSSKMIDLGIEKSIFIKPTTFHLTVLMLKLWNKERVKTATEVLQSVSSKVMDALENRPVLIRLKGLDFMRGSKAKAFVLYAPVEEIGGEGRLLRACQVIIDAFVDAGLVIGKDAEQLKLHATLMNARHRKRKTRSKKVDPFDARGIFKLYGSEDWGEYAIREAHLSQRFAFDENGYYHCCATIPFPQNMRVD
ncbi:uncharacterized protein LOC130992461 isoform X2 [Salvia miltiorrhiza]|uniref:uncharacterized protein LOC130992461 isoform X2 n=1 Tax=Salvia miltiorrhiza TaxID=226208 RepID=UPI0025AD2B6F|nr:uncharacterized protein LOC130992461 isoform X2 [Salvia miltiorrhiza]